MANVNTKNPYAVPLDRPGSGISAPIQELYNANSQTPPSLKGAWPVYPPSNRGGKSPTRGTVVDFAVSHGDPQAPPPPYYPTRIKDIGNVELQAQHQVPYHVPKGVVRGPHR
jgi:hypothetical protein